MNIGDFLIKLREERMISPSLLSKALGIPKGTLSEYERNITTPSLKRFFSIMSYYGIDTICAILGKQIIDITNYSDVGKQKILQIEKEEREKRRLDHESK